MSKTYNIINFSQYIFVGRCNRKYPMSIVLSLTYTNTSFTFKETGKPDYILFCPILANLACHSPSLLKILGYFVGVEFSCRWIVEESKYLTNSCRCTCNRNVTGSGPCKY